MLIHYCPMPIFFLEKNYVFFKYTNPIYLFMFSPMMHRKIRTESQSHCKIRNSFLCCYFLALLCSYFSEESFFFFWKLTCNSSSHFFLLESSRALREILTTPYEQGSISIESLEFHQIVQNNSEIISLE